MPFGRQARLKPQPVIGRVYERLVEVVHDPDVDIGIVQDRIEKQAVGIAAIGQDAAALLRGRVDLAAEQQGRRKRGNRQDFHFGTSQVAIIVILA